MAEVYFSLTEIISSDQANWIPITDFSGLWGNYTWLYTRFKNS